MSFRASKAKNTILVLLLLVVASACQQDDPTPANTENTKVNAWILDNMEFWYLWNDNLPVSPDRTTDPETFFQSLLVTEDRFSWIQEDYQELINSLQGITKEAGYEFVLYKDETTNNVQMQILYIKPGSPAAAAGLKRGDLVTQINSQQITTSNYQDLLSAIKENHALRYRSVFADQQKFSEEKDVSLTTTQYTEDPNYLSKVIDVNGKKIGYYIYNFFAHGTDGDPNEYESEMANIFQNFKSAGITDLVLDLRFNSGGSETAANSLASYIGKGIDDAKVFARRAYNSDVERAIKNDPELGTDFLISKFENKSANIGDMLAGGRVYVLTSSRTASASELVINALKPFMEVFLIGDVTYGKNVGSITLHDEEDATNRWGLQPIVVKVYNSLDQSDYGNGFSPDVIHKDNGLFLYPLGDPNEALLAEAIGQITGTATTGRKATLDSRKILGHSLDLKKRSFNLVIDTKLPLLSTDF